MKDARKTVAAIKDENLGHKDKPDFFTLRGCVLCFMLLFYPVVYLFRNVLV
jgi:hypothetical protein